VAILYAFGERDGVACVPLRYFVALTGLDVKALPKPRPLPRPRPTTQLELFTTAA
jgi:hypothetical protein